MNVNVNHPSFIIFLENVMKSILSNVTVENYFGLTQDKKLGVQYMVYKLLKNSVKLRGKLSDDDMRSFVVVLWKRAEEMENYEFSAILKDISANFDSVNEITKTIKRQPKVIKIDSKE